MPNGRLEISGRFGNFWLPDWHLRILHTVHGILTIFRSCGPRPPKNQTFDKPGGSQTAKYPDNGTGTLKPTHRYPHTETHILIPTHWLPHSDTNALYPHSETHILVPSGLIAVLILRNVSGSGVKWCSMVFDDSLQQPLFFYPDLAFQAFLILNTEPFSHFRAQKWVSGDCKFM